MKEYMKQIPFTLDMAKKIHGGLIKGEIKTREGGNVRGLIFNVNDEKWPLCAVVTKNNGAEIVLSFNIDGSALPYMDTSVFDLTLYVEDEIRKKVYISLPITGMEMEKVVSKANDRKKLLSFKGFEPVTPFDVSPDSNASYAEHMGRDIQALLECDAVYFCRGWQDSKGCQAEYEVAKIYGKQMVFE